MPAYTAYILTGPLNRPGTQYPAAMSVGVVANTSPPITVTLEHNELGTEIVQLSNVGDTLTVDLSHYKAYSITAPGYPVTILWLESTQPLQLTSIEPGVAAAMSAAGLVPTGGLTLIDQSSAPTAPGVGQEILWKDASGNLWLEEYDGGERLVYPVQGLSLGLAGATAATRYVGGTASGAPTGTHPFLVGDFVISHDGHIYVCTVAGSPGTWVDAGDYGTGSATAQTAYPTANVSLANGSYTDVLTINVIAGTYLVSGYINVATAAAQGNIYLQLTDGMNVLAESASTDLWTLGILVPLVLPPVPVTFAGPGTVHLQGQVNVGGTWTALDTVITAHRGCGLTAVKIA